jgi:hypothetical protein
MEDSLLDIDVREIATENECSSLQSQDIQWINVVLLGRKQAGKSAIVKTIQNPEADVGRRTYAGEVEDECRCFQIYDKQSNTVCIPQMKFIELCLSLDESGRWREKLLETCNKFQANHINVICYVSEAGHTMVRDISIFKSVAAALGNQLKHVSMIILTHCDQYQDDLLAQLECEINTSPQSKDFAQYCQLGIARFGALDRNIEEVSESVLRAKIQKIRKHRNELLSLFMQVKIEVPISALKRSRFRLRTPFDRRHLIIVIAIVFLLLVAACLIVAGVLGHLRAPQNRPDLANSAASTKSATVAIASNPH